MNNTQPRTYKSASRAHIAAAYGFSKSETIMKRISARLDKLSDEELQQLGNYTGSARLLPDQVAIIVEMLGTPESPKMLYE